MLTAPEGVQYNWSPADKLSHPTAKKTFLNEYTPTVKVMVADEKNCPMDKEFKVILSCDTLYATKEFNNYTTYSDTVYFKTSPPLQLTAPAEGARYHWEPADNLSQPTRQTTLLNEYTPSVSVTVFDKYDCTIDKEFKVILSCDTLYPTKDLNTYDIYYKTYQDVYLKASQGLEYSWDNSQPLSEYTIQNPKMTAYDSIFNVNIRDKYGCNFNEVFKVLIHCDSLYQTDAFTLKTYELGYGETIILEPTLAGYNVTWMPSESVTCSSCEQIEITALENIRYSASYTDDYNCKLIETFAIEVVLDIPNVITPGYANDGDGKNDTFIIPGLSKDATIKIFDKSGVLVYKADPYNKTNWWNGNNMNGNPVKSGTYWYVLYTTGNTHPIKGFVFVQR